MVQQYASHNDDNGRNVYRLGTFGTVLPVVAGMAKVQIYGGKFNRSGNNLPIAGSYSQYSVIARGYRLTKETRQVGRWWQTDENVSKGLHTNSKLLFAKVFFKTQLRFAVATATKTLSTKNAPEQRVRFCVFAICCKFVSLLFEAFAQPYNDIC